MNVKGYKGRERRKKKWMEGVSMETRAPLSEWKKNTCCGDRSSAGIRNYII